MPAKWLLCLLLVPLAGWLAGIMVRDNTFVPWVSPQLVSDEDALDLGEVPMSGPLDCRGTFHLRNRGWSDIAIDEIISSLRVPGNHSAPT
jgi:hypothetical protein